MEKGAGVGSQRSGDNKEREQEGKNNKKIGNAGIYYTCMKVWGAI